MARRPACHVQADAPPGALLDAFVGAARRGRLRVVVDGLRARATRGARLGGLVAEMLLLPVGHLWALLEVHVDEHAAPDAPHGRELRVVCVAGEREPGNAAKVARILDDTVARLEAGGAGPVQILPWARALDAP